MSGRPFPGERPPGWKPSKPTDPPRRGRYATKECARCHILLPANEMMETTDIPVEATIILNQMTRTPPGRSPYNPKTIFLCEECAALRREGGRQARRIFAAVVAALVLFLALQSLKDEPASPADSTTSTPEAGDAIDESPPAQAQSVDDEPGAVSLTDENVQAPEVASAATRSDAPRADQSQILSYVEENVLPLALESGRSERWGPYPWDPEDNTGYVDVGPEGDDGSEGGPATSRSPRICRAYTISLRQADGSLPAVGTGQRCRNANESF